MQAALEPQASEPAARTAGDLQPSATPQPGTPKPGQPLAILERAEAASVVAQDSSAQTGSNQVAPTSLPSPEQEPQVAVVRTSLTAQSVEVDSLVTDPGRYDTRQVKVTGSLLRLLEHYRLQSQSGLRTLVVDVAGIEPAQREELRTAIDKAGLIGSVQARISGKVERLSANAYRLVAYELVLLE